MANEPDVAQSKTEKIAMLEKKRLETVEKLKDRIRHFHGIKHESSDSEYKYAQIKVLEAHVQSLTEEIEELKKAA
jgi:hypothetical protein